MCIKRHIILIYIDSKLYVLYNALTFKLTVNGPTDLDRYWQLGQDTHFLRADIRADTEPAM